MNGQVSYWFPLSVDESDTEVAHARSIDDCTPKNILTLLQGKLLRNHIIANHSAVAFEHHRLLAIEPPHGGTIRTDSQADVFHLLRAINNGNRPEQDTILGFSERSGKAEELHVIELAVQRMPFKLFLAYLHDGSILRYDFHLFRKILHIELLLQIRISKNDITLDWHRNWLQEQPSLNKASRIGHDRLLADRSEIRINVYR